MRGKRTLNIELIILSIKVDFCPREKLQPTQKIKNFNIKPEIFFGIPMELNQTFSTIEFAILDNPKNHVQSIKYFLYSKVRIPEFKLSISYTV